MKKYRLGTILPHSIGRWEYTLEMDGSVCLLAGGGGTTSPALRATTQHRLSFSPEGEVPTGHTALHDAFQGRLLEWSPLRRPGQAAAASPERGGGIERSEMTERFPPAGERPLRPCGHPDAPLSLPPLKGEVASSAAR